MNLYITMGWYQFSKSDVVNNCVKADNWNTYSTP